MITFTTMAHTQLTLHAGKNRAVRYLQTSRRSLAAVAQFLKLKQSDANFLLDALIEDGKIEKVTSTDIRHQRKIIYAIKDDLAITEIPMFRVTVPFSRSKPRKITEKHVQGGGFGSAPHSYTGGMYGLLTTSD